MPFFLYDPGTGKENPDKKESEQAVQDLEKELVSVLQTTNSSIDDIFEEVQELDTGVTITDEESVGLIWYAPRWKAI